MAAGIRHAHDQGARVLVAINTFPEAGGFALWASAVDDAASLGADAVILADLGLLAYAAERQPQLRLHLSMQAAAANADAIRFYAEAFGVERVVLPRVLSIEETARINRESPAETEVFVFGGLCVMAKGALLALVQRLQRADAGLSRRLRARRVCLRPELPERSIATQARAAEGLGIALEVWASRMARPAPRSSSPR